MYFAEIFDADAVQLDVQKYTFIQLKLSLQLAKKWEIGEDTPGKKDWKPRIFCAASWGM